MFPKEYLKNDRKTQWTIESINIFFAFFLGKIYFISKKNNFVIKDKIKERCEQTLYFFDLSTNEIHMGNNFWRILQEYIKHLISYLQKKNHSFVDKNSNFAKLIV